MKKHDALEAIRTVCKLKHYALTTEETYLYWTVRFFNWLAAHHAELEETPAARMEGFLTDMATI